jgi:galactosamine-6-phosphate isomerase
MELRVYKDYTELSQQVAASIIDTVRKNPEAVLCLAAGDTPKLTYATMVEKAKSKLIDFSRCTFIGLDEWVGIPPDNEGSCHYFLHHNLFNPLKIASSQIHVFDALSPDPAYECGKMDFIIQEKGGIDLMLVGIGMNGHIGFNEPGVSFDLYSHVIDLDENTQAVGQKYFSSTIALPKGITLGLRHFLKSRMAILIANGNKKAPVIKKALKETVNNQMPASIIQQHVNGWVMIDEEAASLIR